MLENLNNNSNENQENEVTKEITETKSEEIIEVQCKEENEENTDSENKENQSEAIPLIIYEKKQDYTNFSGRYYGNSPERNYNHLAQTVEKQVYRWSLEDEEIRLTAKKIKKAKKNLGLKVFAGAMSLMFAFSAVLSGGLLINHLTGSAYPSSSNQFEQMAITVPKTDESENTELTPKEVIAKVKPSVVCIEAEVEVSTGFWNRGGSSSYTETGVGTGFILTEDGYIATNYHVIENAKNINVLMDNGKSYPATLIGGDEAADLAVLKINAKNLPVAELGNSDTTEEGEFVVAIGSPGGVEFAGSSTLGIISAINRNIEVSRGRNMTLLQTDAAINPGNSGGPLVNMNGQVIGINTLKLASTFSTNYEGMGFAIPIKSAVDTFNSIIANPGVILEEYIPGDYNENDTSSVSFGISGGTITESEAALYEIPQGVLVSEVNPDGACGKAGIKAYDIIIALDGETVEDMDGLVALKNQYKAGDKAVVTVDRDGEKLDFTITFDPRETNE